MLTFNFSHKGLNFQINENESCYLIQLTDLDFSYEFDTSEMDGYADLVDILDQAIEQYEYQLKKLAGEAFDPFFWGADEYEFLNNLRGVLSIRARTDKVSINFENVYGVAAAMKLWPMADLAERYTCTVEELRMVITNKGGN